ncbi:molecular chaperone [Qipengyuania sediminis]|uniref:fimbrial biogenesis chaperone n=1 Tax=Qipengyuania sediminis TaxID=1532023 RepID=UPI00105A5C9C|nr:fimbria/pilus periplasmic chaperone [Qipengyuania sediminis]
MTRPVAPTRARMAVALAGSLAFPNLAAPVLAQESDMAAAAAAATASLAVTPLRVELPASATAETVQVQNSTDAPMAVQIRLFAWTQDNGEDVYAPSSDLLISPSIVSIPPRQTQLVRVLRKAGAGAGEKRYRLVVDQLPDPAKARPGVAQTRVRFAIPVFVDRDKAAPAAFAWRLAEGRLELANTGGASARVVQIAVTKRDGSLVTVDENALRYVHGGSRIAWPIAGGCALGSLRVSAQIDGQTVDAEPVPACG